MLFPGRYPSRIDCQSNKSNPKDVQRYEITQLFLGRISYAKNVSHLTAKVKSSFFGGEEETLILDLKSIEEIPQLAHISSTRELGSDEGRS